jgi:cysteine synthase A
MNGAIEKAKEMSEELPNAWLPLQFDNPANIEIHKTATAQEIIKDFPDGLDYMITEWEPVVISLVVPKS